MPNFSAFTSFGFLAFSGRPSRFQEVYEEGKRLFGAYDLEPGTSEEADLYATARVIGYARLALATVENAHRPLSCSPELLVGLEEDYKEIPLTTATLLERRERIASLQKLPQGYLDGVIQAAMTAAIGDAFIAARQLTGQEELNVGGPAIGSFARPDVPLRRFRATEPIFVPGSPPAAFTYENWDTSSETQFIGVGDVVVIEPEDPVHTERVTVTAATAGSQIATFSPALTHPQGCSMVVGHCPLWLSTRLTTLIILTAAGAVDPTIRAKVHDVMRRISPASNAWHIVASTDEGARTTGPFTIGTSPLDATTLDELDYV